MINKTLFVKEWKSNYKILLVFMAVLTVYISIIISMFDPKLGNVLEEFTKAMPELMGMFGMANIETTLVGFICNYLYGMLLIAFPMVYFIMLSARLVVRHVDKGSMSYLLSNGNSRSVVIRTQILVMLTNTLALIGYCALLELVCSQIMFPGELDIAAYLRLNAGLICLHIFISGYCFAISCICDEYKTAMLFGAGVPVLFLLMQMLSNMDGAAKVLKYMTLFTLFKPYDVLDGKTEAYVGCGILVLIGVSCFFVGKKIFERRDLHL